MPHTRTTVQQTSTLAQADRRANERETPPVATTVQLTLHEAEGNRSIIAKLASISYSGLGATCNQPLSPGTKLTYTHPSRDIVITGRVAWCKENEAHGYEHGILNEAFDPATKVDYYALLQINPTAEPCTLEAMYDYLAKRYHSTSEATANAPIYARLAEAYGVLSDPVKRTAYDTERNTAKGGTTVVKGDRNRLSIRSTRNQMLDMLYWRRVESPYKPVITIHEFETILKLPKEQMEFNLWFLRDKGLIDRSDNACFVITAQGVAVAEEMAATDDLAALAKATQEAVQPELEPVR